MQKRRSVAGEGAVPLFVRLPAAQAERLEKAASELGTTKKNLITALVANYVHTASRPLPERQTPTAGGPRRLVVELGGQEPTVGHAAFFPHEQADVLTIAEAAELLRVDPETVENLARSGELPGRRIGDEWRFSRSALVRWLDHTE